MNEGKPVRPIRRDELRKFKNIAVVFGSRDFTDRSIFDDFVDGFIADNDFTREDTVFVSGKARGPDEMIIEYAKQHGWRWSEMPADWSNLDVPGAIIRTNSKGKFNAAAGHIRNAEMAKVSTHGLGFWDGKSTGTGGMIDLCKKLVLRVVRIVA